MKTLILLLTVLTVSPLRSVSSAIEVTYTPLNYPGSYSTFLGGVDGDNIVGSFTGSGPDGDFLYDGNTWTDLDTPAETAHIAGISGKNVIGTTYGSVFESFVYNLDTKTTTHFDDVFFEDIDGNKIIGNLWNSNGTRNGLIYDLDSQIWTSLDHPQAISTSLSGIDGNNIVGYYGDGTDVYQLLYDGTTWTTLDLPGRVIGISANNIVGLDYLYDGTTVTPISFPSARVSKIYAIDGDTIVGLQNISGKQGFIATIPEPTTLLLLGLGAVMLRRKR